MNTKRLEQFDERALQLKSAISISGILGAGRESGPMFASRLRTAARQQPQGFKSRGSIDCPPLDGYQFCFICLGKYHISSQAFERAHQDSSESLKVYDEAGYKHRTVFGVPGYTLDSLISIRSTRRTRRRTADATRPLAAGGLREHSQMRAGAAAPPCDPVSCRACSCNADDRGRGVAAGPRRAAGAEKKRSNRGCFGIFDDQE
jgi:hypothetical protein